MKFRIGYGWSVLVLSVAAYACSKQERPAATPAPAANGSDTNRTLRDDAHEVNRAVVRTGDEVERGVQPATKKLNQGADAIDSALKGK